jgi:hypothetical protein
MTQLDFPSRGISVLFSYETPVAAFCEEKGFMRTSTKYSVTTSKHINYWLNTTMNAPAIVDEVDQGIIDELLATDGVPFEF